MNVVDVMRSRRMFGEYFEGSSWSSWETYLRCLFGLFPMGNDVELFRSCTGLDHWPARTFGESYVIAGRRSGKTSIAAMVAAYLALFFDWRPYLKAGEKGYIFIIAVNKAQAKIARDRVAGLLSCKPSFRLMITRELAEEIELANNVVVSVKPASFRSLRGFTVLACILEELSFWRFELDSASPDVEIVRALRPSMATVPRSLLLGISSPYSKSGFLYDVYSKFYGKPGSGPLIWRAATRTMNPTIAESTIAADFELDPVAAATEWGAEFRPDLSSYVPPEVVEAVVVPRRHELAFDSANEYSAFIDPSGGSQDSFTLAIAHRDKKSGRVVLDLLRERVPPFSPEDVVAEFGKVLAGYKIDRVTSDRYAGEWPREQFRKHGITVEPSKLTKSEIYLEFLPLLSAGAAELLDNRRLTSQLRSLDRRSRSGGRDLVDNFHGHDDCANAAAGVAVVVAQAKALKKSRVHVPGPRLPWG